ncbi:MAG: type I DNA topoisomerase [Rickettsiales bacterium]|jgi:DNA topoisomerase-1|nr:type I DNA topoisomerase [Rickettsiales bacterium]
MNLLIVESPAKSKTIEKYLGPDFHVLASIGHVRDLAPEDGSVDTARNFKMKWQIMPDKEKQLKLIGAALKKADALYLATDQDREGEAIAWHLYEILDSRGALAGKKVYRITFNEITKKAVQAALEKPREIDRNLVNAYLGRRALDYLMGFNLSPILWRKLPGAKSAGRVQSVALALIVQREKEIEEFKAAEYWSVDSLVAAKGGKFKARLNENAGKKIEKMTLENKAMVDAVLKSLAPGDAAKVKSVEKKQTSRRPAAPFTTSTLQQEASRKLHFGAQRAMRSAQKLYEKGFITYMRTDAVALSADAVSGIRDYIKGSIGPAYLPEKPVFYANKSKNAQEAHEAIRPTDFARSSVLGLVEHSDEEKLYELIWKRAVSSQMENARFDSVVVDIEPVKNPGTVFHAVGTTQTFDGFLKLYQEGQDDAEDEKEAKLPVLAEGDAVVLEEFLPEQHFTLPPPRFSEASLVKRLEELGIGRPSTYAAILSVIVQRGYAELAKQRFFATERGWLVSAFLGLYFQKFVAVDFTAGMEDQLDEVSNGGLEWVAVLSDFWKIFSASINDVKDINNQEVMVEMNKILASHIFKDQSTVCPECKKGKLSLRLSRFGGFLGCDRYPECKYIKNLASAAEGGEGDGDAAAPRGETVDLGEGISFRVGRYGPYVQEGDGKDAKRASAKPETAETITLDKAKELLAGAGLAAPKELGSNAGKKVYFYASGRFGPYISSDKVNVSVKAEPTLDEAIALIEKKKLSPPKKFFKRK